MYSLHYWHHQIYHHDSRGGKWWNLQVIFRHLHNGLEIRGAMCSYVPWTWDVHACFKQITNLSLKFTHFKVNLLIQWHFILCSICVQKFLYNLSVTCTEMCRNKSVPSHLEYVWGVPHPILKHHSYTCLNYCMFSWTVVATIFQLTQNIPPPFRTEEDESRKNYILLLYLLWYSDPM